MGNIVILLLAAGALFSATLVKGEAATGVVSEVDRKAGLLILQDGTTFVLPEEISVSSLQAGDEVTVYFEVNEENNNLADAIIPVF